MTITYIKTELAPADNQLAAYLYFTSDTPVSYSYTVTKRTTSPTSVDFTYTSDLIYGVTQTIKIPVIGLYMQTVCRSYLRMTRVLKFSISHLSSVQKIRNMIHLSSSTSILSKPILHYLPLYGETVG